DPEAQLRHARAHRATGEWDAALAALDVAASHGADPDEVAAVRGMILLDAGKPGLAKRAFDRPRTPPRRLRPPLRTRPGVSRARAGRVCGPGLRAGERGHAAASSGARHLRAATRCSRSVASWTRWRRSTTDGAPRADSVAPTPRDRPRARTVGPCAAWAYEPACAASAAVADPTASCIRVRWSAEAADREVKATRGSRTGDLVITKLARLLSAECYSGSLSAAEARCVTSFSPSLSRCASRRSAQLGGVGTHAAHKVGTLGA